MPKYFVQKCEKVCKFYQKYIEKLYKESQICAFSAYICILFAENVLFLGENFVVWNKSAIFAAIISYRKAYFFHLLICHTHTFH